MFLCYDAFMTCITIQCRLVTNESTRRHFWHLMGELNTPLVNELLQQIPEHPDFDIWQIRGYLPAGLVQERCNVLKTDTRFQGQPSRFYKSAIALVNYIYKSSAKINSERFCVVSAINQIIKNCKVLLV